MHIYCIFRHELALALQQEGLGDAVVTDLQALQNAAQSQARAGGAEATLITSVNPQTADPLGVADSTLMTGVNQQYLTSGNDDLDENRTDTIIQDGQFSLNTQVSECFPERNYVWSNDHVTLYKLNSPVDQKFEFRFSAPPLFFSSFYCFLITGIKK